LPDIELGAAQALQCADICQAHNNACADDVTETGRAYQCRQTHAQKSVGRWPYVLLFDCGSPKGKRYDVANEHDTSNFRTPVCCPNGNGK
jgi:hypothetical protein